VWRNFGHKFHISKQEIQYVQNKMYLETFNLWVITEKNTFITSAQNVLHEIQCTPQYVSSWTAASVQRCRGSCGQSDRHPQCDGEAPLRCQRVLHTQGFYVSPQIKTQRVKIWRGGSRPDSVLLYLSIGHDRCYWEHLAQHGAPSCRVLTASGTHSSNFDRSSM
jgi:hypothetical protein